MGNLSKVVVVCLFVALVTIVIITGIHKMEEQKASKGPGPQVPDKHVVQPPLEREVDPGDTLKDPIEPITGTDTASSTVLLEDGVPMDCTADVQICPDGSAVGRTGPSCEFAECPVQTITVSKLCTATQKNAEECTMEYAPVCGLVEVQCVTTPCEPVPQTFSNACGACTQGNVVSYSEGECGL